MSKIARADITGALGLGFTQSMFSSIASTAVLFDSLVDAIIAEEASRLEERVGSAAYALAANIVFLKNAEKCLTAAELIRRRINALLGIAQTAGQEVSAENERRQRKDYLDEAETWIGKVSQGVTTDGPEFSCGSLVTSHFE